MSNGNDNETPMECKFQLDPYICDLDGYIKAEVHDLDSQQPSTIIGCNEGGVVRVEWGIRGPLAHHLCGEWCVCVYLESIGPGPEIVVPDSCRTISGKRVMMDHGYMKYVFLEESIVVIAVSYILLESH